MSVIRAIGGCAEKYAQAHPQLGFPARLDLLGPAGTDCLDPKTLSRSRDGYNFSYAPGAADKSGRVPGYSIHARPIRRGATGQRSFFRDESGAIRATEEDRPATAQDRPI